MINETHDLTAVTWVDSARDHADFPVQNLPLGVWLAAQRDPRPCMAIGDELLDLRGVADVLGLSPALRAALGTGTLNALFALAPADREALRLAVFRALCDGSQQPALSAHLHSQAGAKMLLPVAVRDYTDFYAGIHHATTVGSLLRPENPLLPNYKYIPVGYHGRSSSIRVSGGNVVRPRGQVKAPDAETPQLQPSARLDYEVELAIWAAGSTQLGDSIALAQVDNHIAGLGLLNDWSARDIQAWEYVPLGPFLAKNFATTVSPWVVTMEALAPFRGAPAPRPEGDPAPLPYLDAENDRTTGAFDIQIEVTLRTAQMRDADQAPTRLGSMNARELYWTPGQMVTHHTINGCDLAAGDLLGTGTISGADDSGRGSLMELSRGGRQPVTLPNGETRSFLADGDEVTLAGWCEREGFRRIGFGSCSATVVAAPVS